MNRTFDFAIAGSCAASRLRVVTAAKLHNIAGIIFDDLVAADDVAKAQPYFSARFQAEEFTWGNLEKVVLLNPQLSGERQLACA